MEGGALCHLTGRGVIWWRAGYHLMEVGVSPGGGQGVIWLDGGVSSGWRVGCHRGLNTLLVFYDTN